MIYGRLRMTQIRCVSYQLSQSVHYATSQIIRQVLLLSILRMIYMMISTNPYKNIDYVR